MPNGDCVIGAECKTEIAGLKEGKKVQDAAIQRVESKLDRINWWLVALLGGMVVSLALQIANGVTKG